MNEPSAPAAASQPTQSSAVAAGTSAAPPSGEHDWAIGELAPETKQWLAHVSEHWLNSLGFCTVYESSPAERVWARAGEGGCASAVIYYRRRRWCGWANLLEIVGYPSASSADIRLLLQRHDAQLATVHRLRSPSTETGLSDCSARIEITHDVIAALPASKDEYFQALSKKKREQLPYYLRRLQRTFPDGLSIDIKRGLALELTQITQLAEFNQARMHAKGKQNAAAEEAQRQQRRWPLTQASGLLVRVMAGSRVLGGTFNYLHGSEAALIIVAHDPDVERLNVGTIALWKTIENLIELGVTRYHLFWGRKQYKTDFLGVDHPVSLDLITPHRWIVPLWRAQMMVRMNVPRAVRLVRGMFGRVRKPESR